MHYRAVWTSVMWEMQRSVWSTRLNRRHNASVAVQAAWKGYAARKQYAPLRHSMRAQWARRRAKRSKGLRKVRAATHTARRYNQCVVLTCL